MIRRALNGDVAAQPQDVSLTLFDLGLVLMVGLDVSMRQGMGMLRIRLMDMLRCNRDRPHPGTESENQGETPD